VLEKNGLIMAWCDEEDKDPWFDVPELEETTNGEWTDYESYEWKVKSHNYDSAENSVDTAHFQYLHGVPEMPENTLTTEGHILHSYSSTPMATPQGTVDAVIDTIMWGFGFSRILFTGITDLMLVTSVTPLDGEHIRTSFNFMLKKDSGVDPSHGVGKAFISEICRQFEQDIPIWENKIYMRPPNLVKEDGPIVQFRRWGAQFFPDGTFSASAQVDK